MLAWAKEAGGSEAVRRPGIGKHREGNTEGSAYQSPKEKTPREQQSNSEVYKAPGKRKLGLQVFVL